MAKRTVTLYLTGDRYERLKQLVAPRPISQEIDELMGRRLAELEDREYDPEEPINYEALKSEYNKVVKDVDNLQKTLVKRKVYDELRATANNCGLDEEDTDFSGDVTECMLKTWNERGGYPEDVHQWISLMELVKKKRQLERQLTEIRSQTKTLN